MLGPRCRFVFFHSEDVLADIGPELFKDIGAGSDNHLCGEVFGGFAEAAFGGGVVEVRQSGFRGIAANLGDVEFVGAPVVPGDKATAEGVADALEEAVLSEGGVAGVLVGKSGQDSLGEEGARDLVGELSPVVTAEAGGPRAEGGDRIGIESL